MNAPNATEHVRNAMIDSIADHGRNVVAIVIAAEIVVEIAMGFAGTDVVAATGSGSFDELTDRDRGGRRWTG